MVAMALPGELRVVVDVAAAFCDIFEQNAPRSVALSGGATAEACYRALADRALDWSRVDVLFGDERLVPVHHPDSNEGMARQEFGQDGRTPVRAHGHEHEPGGPARLADQLVDRSQETGVRMKKLVLRLSVF